MGTRMLSALESPVHQNWNDAVVAAAETDTILLDRHGSPALRALRTERTSALDQATDRHAMQEFGDVQGLYFGGDLEAAIPLTGQVAGRIEAVEPVADTLDRCARGCLATISRLAATYSHQGMGQVV